MSRPLDRLVEMGLVRREVPFGESEKKTRRALYKIDDPFFRLWFRVVAPHRGQLATSPRSARRHLLERLWRDLAAHAWEDLCRQRLPHADVDSALGRRGPWGPAARWWKGASAEWDVVSRSLDEHRVLVGEAKWSARPFTTRGLERLVREVESRTPPELPGKLASREPVRALFVPEREGRAPETEVLIVTATELIPHRP